MSSNWRTVCLGDVTSWLSGGTPKKDNPEYWGGSIPWISASSMSGTRYSSSDLKITDRGLQAGSKLAPKNAVLLLVRGSALHKDIPLGIACKDVAFNQDVKAIIANPEIISPWYLLFYFLSQKNYLLKNVVEYTGIGAGKLDTARLQALKIPLPSIDEQLKIIDIIRPLDDRIMLLRETNATLEAIAQALFKSWFVDFDPVRAKAEGREPEGVPPEVVDLFPDELVESKLGTSPKGWEIAGLDSIAKFLNGLALQKFPPEDDDNYLPVIKIAQLRKGDVVGADRASMNIKPEYVVADGDILFSWSGSLETVIWCGGPGALNQHLFKVTSANFPKWFFFNWVRHHLPQFREIAAHKATTMGHIQRHHLTEAKVVVPQPQLITALSEIMEPLMERQIQNLLQIRALTELRDTLLPRLMSGKLRIPDAEKELDAIQPTGAD